MANDKNMSNWLKKYCQNTAIFQNNLQNTASLPKLPYASFLQQ
jgi:hypothetical protein